MNILNFLVLSANFCKANCAGCKPEVNACKADVLLCRDIEKYNAIKNNKIHKHMKKWYNVQVESRIEYQAISDDVVSDYIEQMQYERICMYCCCC